MTGIENGVKISDRFRAGFRYSEEATDAIGPTNLVSESARVGFVAIGLTWEARRKGKFHSNGDEIASAYQLRHHGTEAERQETYLG